MQKNWASSLFKGRIGEAVVESVLGVSFQSPAYPRVSPFMEKGTRLVASNRGSDQLQTLACLASHTFPTEPFPLWDRG